MRPIFIIFAGFLIWASAARAQWISQPGNQIVATPDNTPGYQALRPLVSRDLFQANSCLNGQLFYNNLGVINCISPVSSAGGTVTSAGLSFTGGLLTVANSPVTVSGTLAVTVAGTSGGLVYFNSGSTWASSAALTANRILIGGGAGAPPVALGSLGTTTQVLHGNAAGLPTWGGITAADVTTALASPPPIGSTAPATGAFTTVSASGISSLSNLMSTAPAGQPMTFAFGAVDVSDVWSIPAASATIPEISAFYQMDSSIGSASGNTPGSSAFKMGLGVQTNGHVGTANIYGENISVNMDSGVGHFSMSGLEVDLMNSNLDYPEGGSSGAVGTAISVATAGGFPIEAAIKVGTIASSTYGVHDGIHFLPQAFNIKDYAVHDESSSTISYYDTGTHVFGATFMGSYLTASIYMDAKPDFHYAGSGTCAPTGSIAVLINGVSHAIPYC